MGEIVGAASFTFFVKGAGFSSPFQSTLYTEEDLTASGNATSHSEIVAYHAFVPRSGPVIAADSWRGSPASRHDCQTANGLVYTPLGSESHTRDSIQSQELNK